MKIFSDNNPRRWAPFAVFFLYLVVVFFLGGGSRPDIAFLEVLRPVSALFLGYGLWRLRRDQVRAYRELFWVLGAASVLTALHLVPLPPGLWHALPGRELAAQVDRAVGANDQWRPLSLVPFTTWNALFALLVPITALVLVVQLDRDQRAKLLLVLLGLGFLSGLWGLIQLAGASDGPLYLYQVTNNGAAVGLFANRNHQALLLASLVPMLAVFASYGVKTVEQRGLRGWLAAAGILFLVPLLLVTGSRTGLVLGILGLASVFLVYKRPEIERAPRRKGGESYGKYVFGMIGVALMVLLTVVMARANVFDRLAVEDPVDDQRFQIAGPILDMGWKYFPFGSGIGTFVDVFRIGEPNTLLDTSYFNHAHNDFLEIWMTGGIPAVLLLFAVFVVGARAAWAAFMTKRVRDDDLLLQRLSVILFIMMLIASATDYPLRTPIIECVAIVAAAWLTPSQRLTAEVSPRVQNNDGSPLGLSLGSGKID